MRKVALLAGLVLVSCNTFAGDEDARRAAAERLLKLFNMDQTYQQAMQQAAQMATGMVDSQNLSKEDQEQAKKAIEQSIAISMEKFSWAKMQKMFVEIYTEVLSLEDIQGLIAFYESPTGRRFIAKQPELTTATMKQMQTLMTELMPAIQKEAEKLAKQTPAGSGAARPAPAPQPK